MALGFYGFLIALCLSAAILVRIETCTVWDKPFKIQFGFIILAYLWLMITFACGFRALRAAPYRDLTGHITAVGLQHDMLFAGVGLYVWTTTQGRKETQHFGGIAIVSKIALVLMTAGCFDLAMGVLYPVVLP